MNDHIDILLNSLALLIREYETFESTPPSLSLVANVLSVIPNGKSGMISVENDIVGSLKDLLTKVIQQDPFIIDKVNIIQSLSLMFTDELKHVFDTFVMGVKDELSKKGAKSRIKNLTQQLEDFYFVHKARKLFSSTSFKLRNESKDGSTARKFVQKSLEELEALISKSKETDAAIVDEIDFKNRDEILKVTNIIETDSEIGGKYITGWQGINEMVQDGFTEGEFIVVNALAHKYKTGFSLSLFMQMILYNKPEVKDPGKKPLATWISFEDDLTNVLQFMYLYLKKNETGTCPVVKNLSANDLADYVISKLESTGWDVKILRVNPSDWSYRHLFNKILTYNNMGYELKLLGLDYLAMIPTIGCTQGPYGVDMRDLFRRVRNFTSA